MLPLTTVYATMTTLSSTVSEDRYYVPSCGNFVPVSSCYFKYAIAARGNLLIKFAFYIVLPRNLGNCLACKDLGTAMNITQQFISDCKINNQSRNLKNGAFSRLGSLPSSTVYVVVMVASVTMGAALGL